jgi:hypothetical protein
LFSKSNLWKIYIKISRKNKEEKKYYYKCPILKGFMDLKNIKNRVDKNRE